MSSAFLPRFQDPVQRVVSRLGHHAVDVRDRGATVEAIVAEADGADQRIGARRHHQVAAAGVVGEPGP